ncbi:MAG: methionine adenosyltransferase [Flavobacteriaceae bacterium]|nr:methionine adenosyltransferase [Flavobacteriaceae bacterium]|tara:strand:+ start:3728 stop:4888 length:1161 start_codon:yes stop_codon:yes gene_type:complete
MDKEYLFTSESVSEGHPDKVCDIISDYIVDDFLSQPNSENWRVALETLVTTNQVVVSGEVRGPDGFKCDYDSLARQAVKEIGYEQEKFHWQNFNFTEFVHAQSGDIAMGVDSKDNKDQGAGDQGIMFGYACKETPVLMPAPIYYSHLILRNLAEARKKNLIKGIQPDSKSQVTLKYKDSSPIECTEVVVSTQHDEDLELSDVEEIVTPFIKEAIPEDWLKKTQFHINPTGRFVTGGPDGDTGLTGRKIIVDTYGGAAPHGGGAFSGKDPTKVDRSAAYISRYLAKNIVAADLADKCTIQLAYAIGVSRPLSFYVNTHGSGKIDNDVLIKKLNDIVDLTPRGIRDHLELHKPIYKSSAAYGHFGREAGTDGSFSWEKTDLVDQLKNI